MIWFSWAIAVSTAILVTEKWTLLWFMLFPLFFAVANSTLDKNDK